jgi:hypothetical protein
MKQKMMLFAFASGRGAADVGVPNRPWKASQPNPSDACSRTARLLTAGAMRPGHPCVNNAFVIAAFR